MGVINWSLGLCNWSFSISFPGKIHPSPATTYNMLVSFYFSLTTSGCQMVKDLCLNLCKQDLFHLILNCHHDCPVQSGCQVNVTW